MPYFEPLNIQSMKLASLFFLTIFLPKTAFLQNCSGGGPASTASFSLVGKLSMDEKDDVSNQKGTLSTTSGKIVAVQYTGVNFLPIVTDSYCDDVAIDISSAGSNNFLYFSTVNGEPPCTDLPKSALVSWFGFGGGVGTNGTSTWELYEVFDEAPNAVDANYTAGTFKIFVCPLGQFLPMVLTTFYGKTTDRTNVLIWETATEINVQNHIIERSHDASKWKEIGRFDGKENGNEAKTYELEDANPLPAAYYRLRTVDCDGSATVSKMVFLDRASNLFEVSQIFPNPAHEKASLTFTAQTESKVLVQIIDINGRAVWAQNFEANAGENQLPLNLFEVPAGVYFVSITSGTAISSPVRFMKY